MTTRRIFRYTIPDDGQEHTVRLTSEPLHVSTGQLIDEVDFWAEHDDDALEYPATFQVVGTGHPIPQGAAYTGTCPRTRGLVLHLYRIPTQQATP